MASSFRAAATDELSIVYGYQHSGAALKQNSAPRNYEEPTMIIVHHFARSAGPQPHQSQRSFRTQKFGVTSVDLRDAKVGNSAKAVEAELAK